MCAEDELAALVAPRPGSSVFVPEESSPSHRRLPLVSASAVKDELAEILSAESQPPLIMLRTIDRLSGLLGWYVVEGVDRADPLT